MIDMVATGAGVLLYVGLMFWFGTKAKVGWAILLSAPPTFGLLISLLSPEAPFNSSWLFRHFESLAIGQLLAGLISYWLGASKARRSQQSQGTN